MASKLVVLRQRLGRAVHAAFVAWTDEVTPPLDERVAAYLEEGEAIDFRVLQRVLRRMVEASLERLVAADKAHLDELVDDVAAREERDRAAKAVRAQLVDIRRIAEALFGRVRAGEVVAVDGPTAEQPELLWRQAEHTMTRLADPERELPEAKTRGVRFEAQTLAEELEPEVEALRLAIDAVERDRKEAALTCEAKRLAMEEHDLLMGACGKIQQGLYLLAGRGDLARRVRVTPPRHRRKGTAEEAAAESLPAERPEAPAAPRAGSGENQGEPEEVQAGRSSRSESSPTPPAAAGGRARRRGASRRRSAGRLSSSRRWLAAARGLLRPGGPRRPRSGSSAARETAESSGDGGGEPP